MVDGEWEPIDDKAEPIDLFGNFMTASLVILLLSFIIGVIRILHFNLTFK